MCGFGDVRIIEIKNPCCGVAGIFFVGLAKEELTYCLINFAVNCLLKVLITTKYKPEDRVWTSSFIAFSPVLRNFSKACTLTPVAA